MLPSISSTSSRPHATVTTVAIVAIARHSVSAGCESCTDIEDLVLLLRPPVADASGRSFCLFLRKCMSAASIEETDDSIRQPNLVRDVAAIGLVALTLIMTVSVVTHSSADPIATPVWPISAFYSPDTVVYPLNDSITNACGYWGALLASMMFDAVGFAAALVIGALGSVAIALLVRGRLEAPVLRSLGGTIVILAAATAFCHDAYPSHGNAGGWKRWIPGSDDINLVTGAFRARRRMDTDPDTAGRRPAADDRVCVAVCRQSDRQPWRASLATRGCSGPRGSFRSPAAVVAHSPIWTSRSPSRVKMMGKNRKPPKRLQKASRRSNSDVPNRLRIRQPPTIQRVRQAPN